MKRIPRLLENVWVSVFFLSVLFTAAYWIPLAATVKTWETNADYSYGFLIPIVSIYLLWDLRERLKGLVLKCSWSFFPFLLFFVLLSIYGILGSSGHIARPTIPVLIILITGFCFGYPIVKTMSLPLGFLIFMVPLPTLLDRTIGVFLKSVSSHLGGMLIEMWGISVHVSGNIIDLGVTKLQVVDACSGLRFVFPLLALGIVYAHFFERVLWKKIICVLATIPIAIVTNGIRIGLTGILTEYYGPKVAEGFFHDFSGWAIFMVAFAFLFFFGRILRFFPAGHPTVPMDTGTNEGVPRIYPTNINRDVKVAVGISGSLLLVVLFLTLNTQAMPRMGLKGGIAGFPLRFDRWNGKAEIVSPEIITESGAEEAFSATYGDGVAGDVSLYIGYRGSAFLENENFFHSPTVCLPASGWELLQQSKYTIKGVPHFGDLTVTRMVMEAMGTKMLVYFWFQTKDMATYDKNINRFHLALHAIRKDNTHDLFIRTIVGVRSDEDLLNTEDRLNRFVNEMMPVLLEYVNTNQTK